MPNKLFVRPVSSLNSTLLLFDWALFDIANQKISHGEQAEFDSIEQTLMQNGVENVDLYGIWPSSAAFSTHVSLPGNQTRYIQQALPFAVEDQLAQDVDLLHLALGSKTKDGQFPVVGVDQELIEPFFELLSLPTHGFLLKGIFLDADLLPMGEADMVLAIYGNEVLIFSHNHLAIGISLSNLGAYMDSIFLGTPEEGDADDTFAIKVFLAKDQQEELKIQLAELEQYPHAQLDVEPTSFELLDILCESLLRHEKTPINLCQGDLRVTSVRDSIWHRWRYVAGIAALGFLVQLGVFIGKGVMYEQQAVALGDQAVSAYRSVVPGSRSISVDKLPRIIKGKLNQANQSGGADLGFLALLGEAGYQFQQAPNKSGLAFRSINYNAQRGELVMEMQAQNFDQLDKLKQAIVDAGYSAKISSAVQEDNFFRGRISVSGS